MVLNVWYLLSVFLPLSSHLVKAFSSTFERDSLHLTDVDSTPLFLLPTGEILPSLTVQEVPTLPTTGPSPVISPYMLTRSYSDQVLFSADHENIPPMITRSFVLSVSVSPPLSTQKPQKPHKHPLLTPSSSSRPIPVQMSCPYEIDHMFGIPWHKTWGNTERKAPCPSTFSGMASRFCRRDGRWNRPDFSQCEATSIEGLDETANLFFNSGEEDREDAEQFVRQLRNLTRPPPKNHQQPFLDRNNLRTVNFVTRRTLRLLRQQTNDSMVSSEIFGLLNNALDSRNIYSWEDLQQFESGSEELLSNAENYAGIFASRLRRRGESVRYSEENIVMRAERHSVNGGLRDSQFPNDDDLVNSSAVNSSIRIPSTYLKAIAGSDDDVVIAFLLFYTLQDFLPYEAQQENTTVASVILSAQVMSSTIENSISSVLTENRIELMFSINAAYITSTENISARCVYWNFSTDFNTTSSGGWVSEGIVTEITDDFTVRCLSQHLTSFAVLVDVVGTNAADNNDTSSTNELQGVILSWVSYIGCGISIICLIATIIFLLTLKNELLTQVHNFIHLNLAISLLLGLIVFVGGIEYAADYKVACTIVALLLHYFFLSAFCWMFCEAMMLYLLAVVVFSRLTKKWYLYLVIGWGTPLIIVGISFGATFSDYIKDSSICWLNYSNYVIWSFTGPMCLIIYVNVVLLFIVCVELFRTRKKMRQFKKYRTGLEGQTDSHETRQTVIKLTKAVVILLPLLGITWVVGIFALDENTLFFAWLFTVLNSLQGAFIFFFHVLLNRVKMWYTKRERIQENTISTRKSMDSLDNPENFGTEKEGKF